MNDIVLDASALLAFLQNETGGNNVEKYLANACMSSVNFSEVITILNQNGIHENIAKELITDVISEIIPFDSEQAFYTAILRQESKKFGLSFGDRACLVLAQQKKATVLTADKIWKNLHLENVRIEIIR